MIREAVETGTEGLPHSRMRTVLTVNHAIELLLPTMLSRVGIRVRGQPNIPQMLDPLLGKHPALESHRTPVTLLYERRNLVQHQGLVPSTEDTRQTLLYGESFVRDTVREVEGKELEELSIVALLVDEGSRNRLQTAERALLTGDCRGAAAYAALALAERFGPRPHRRGKWRPLTSSEALASAMSSGGSDEFTREFVRSLRPVFEPILTALQTLELAGQGISLEGYFRLEQIMPRRLLALGGRDPFRGIPSDWDVSERDAMFAVDFVSAALLTVDRRQAKASPETTSDPIADQSASP
jgi:hypothetical protein